MNKLKTTIDDISFQQALCGLLAFAAVIGAFSAMGIGEILEDATSKKIQFKIFKFLICDIPYALWSLIEFSITVYFFLFFKKCIPNASKAINNTILAIVFLLASGTLLELFSDDSESSAMLFYVLEMIAEIVLSVMLIQKYDGQVKTMGIIFIIEVVLYLFMLVGASAIFEEGDRYSISMGMVICPLIMGLLPALPWYCMNLMLKDNIAKGLNTDEDDDLIAAEQQPAVMPETTDAVDHVNTTSVPVTPLVAPVAPAPVAPAPEAETSTYQPESQRLEPTATTPAQPDYYAPAPKSKRNKLGIIVAVCIIVIGLITLNVGLFVYHYGHNDDINIGTSYNDYPEYSEDDYNDAYLSEEDALLPSWMPASFIEAFGVSDLSQTRNRLSESNLLEKGIDYDREMSLSGKFDDKYPIRLKIQIGSNGSVSGRYAYESTLRNYGDKPSSWFLLDGDVMFDRDYSPYLALKSYHPDTQQVFEYFLVKVNSSTRYKGTVINKSHINQPLSEMETHSISIGY